MNWIGSVELIVFEIGVGGLGGVFRAGRAKLLQLSRKVFDEGAMGLSIMELV
jgi:hypothetical protein